MAINFNALPSEKPAMGTLVPQGQYVATIEKADMKQGKDETKPPYLNLQLDLVDEASETHVGKIFHILTESTHQIPMYQLKRFIEALKLPITDSFELKDLSKMVVGKKMLVDIVPEKAEEGKEPTKSVVDVYTGQVFYPLETSPLQDNTFTDIPDAPPINASAPTETAVEY